jgi:hypothetical protein
MLTHDQLVDLLRKETLKTSQRKWAKAHGYSIGFINNVINGITPLSPGLAEALGYEIRYVKTKTV